MRTDMYNFAKTNRRGFTLIEILVVIAISVILFALLLRPLSDAFRMTQRAQVVAAAQDSARKTLETITRELGSAVYVFDNASHPIVGSNTSSTAVNDRYTNFLDLEITNKNGQPVIAQAFNAKLDMVAARETSGAPYTLIDPVTKLPVLDPTTGQPVVIPPQPGSPAYLIGSAPQVPLAPGTSMVRYFIGLKRPAEYDNTGTPLPGHYSNSNEGLLAPAGQEDNTYILYRAQFLPFNGTDPNTGKPKGNADGTTVNELLFTPQYDAGGNIKNLPEYDDPDFFRYVSTTDVNWLSADHHNYTSSEMADHNKRVAHWQNIAKPIITAPDIDLILLPHNRDDSLAYDTNGEFTGVAHSGVAHDPMKVSPAGDYPIVNTSVTFRPATVSNDAAPATNTDYASAGAPANAANSGGLPYIPTLYTSSSQSWSYPYHITIYPLRQNVDNNGNLIGSPFIDPNQTLFDIKFDTTGTPIEYRYANATQYNAVPNAGTPVYNLASGQPLNGSEYVPVNVNADNGTINFSVPALPVPANPYNRFWQVDPTAIDNGTAETGVSAGSVDLTKLTNSPLAPTDGSAASGSQVTNAHIVTGSLRVLGPDWTFGPNRGNSVPYTEVFAGQTPDVNQYYFDPVKETVTFGNAALGTLLPTAKTDGTNADPVQIAFDYQANLAPLVHSQLDESAGAATAISTSNPAAPMLIKVDYQTRDLINVDIGVRVYDASSGHAIVVNVSSPVKIGNSNR